MPEDVYTVVYDASSATAAAKAIEYLTGAVVRLDSAVQKSRQNFAGFADKGGSSASGAEKDVKGLTAAMDSLGAVLADVNRSMNGFVGGADKIGEAFKKVGAGASGALGPTRALGLAMMAYHEVVAVLKALGDGLRDAREKTDELAAANITLRDRLRELANLKGKPAADNQVTGEVIALAMTAGMPVDDAAELSRRFEGSIPEGRKRGNIAPGKSPAEQKAMERQMEEVGAGFAARTGVAPGVAGDLAGVVSQYTKVNKIEDFAGQLGAVAHGLNEGRGDLTPLIKSELGIAGGLTATGRVQDLAEVAAWVGATSTVAKDPRGAGNKVLQADALLNTTPEKAGGDHLHFIGADKKTSDMEKLRVLRDDMVKNGGKDWEGYLAAKGFGNREEVAAAVELASGFDTLEKRAGETRAIVKTGGGGVIAANRDFRDNTTTGQARVARASKQAAEFTQGEAKETLVVAREAAEARLRARGQIDTPESNAEDWWFDNVQHTPFELAAGGRTNKEKRISMEVQRHLIAEGSGYGVQPFGPDSNVPMGDRSDERLIGGIRAVRAAGGTGIGGNEEVVSGLKTLQQQQREANNHLAKIAGGIAGRPGQPGPGGPGDVGGRMAPPPGKPAAVPKR